MELSTLELTPEEKQVYDFIKEHTKVTQLDIVKGCPNLGSHPRHENYDNTQSTTRKIRSIIRSLIMKHGLYILADTKGYWIKNTQEEANDYMAKFERKAKASAKSYMQRYHVMKKLYGYQSDYFEQQNDLFGNEI